MKKTNPKVVLRLRRKKRIRARLRGTEESPRISVFRSSKHIYAQLIDDITGKTLVAASDLSSELVGEVKTLSKSETARKVGELFAEKCLQAGYKQVVFDRNGFIYHGRVKALAEGARKVRLSSEGEMESYGDGLKF